MGLNAFWKYVASCLPLTLAPNLMTLTGLACVDAALCLLLWFSPQLRGEAPAGVYLACAGLLFAYQTLDGSDGHQARRTGMASPLGELFDHSVDANAAVPVALLAADFMGLGHAPLSLALAVSAILALWYASNAVLLVTGRYDIGLVDNQEALVAIMAGLVAKAWWGTVEPLLASPLHDALSLLPLPALIKVLSTVSASLPAVSVRSAVVALVMARLVPGVVLHCFAIRRHLVAAKDFELSRLGWTLLLNGCGLTTLAFLLLRHVRTVSPLLALTWVFADVACADVILPRVLESYAHGRHSTHNTDTTKVNDRVQAHPGLFLLAILVIARALSSSLDSGRLLLESALPACVVLCALCMLVWRVVRAVFVLSSVLNVPVLFAPAE
jgi:phosphatidylglycerophosphate synthase